jgi:hypothetical protein
MEQGKVAPIHLYNPFSNVGLMLLNVTTESGKTNDALKHLLITDHLIPHEALFILRLSTAVV